MPPRPSRNPFIGRGSVPRPCGEVAERLCVGLQNPFKRVRLPSSPFSITRSELPAPPGPCGAYPARPPARPAGRGLFLRAAARMGRPARRRRNGLAAPPGPLRRLLHRRRASASPREPPPFDAKQAPGTGYRPCKLRPPRCAAGCAACRMQGRPSPGCLRPASRMTVHCARVMSWRLGRDTPLRCHVPCRAGLWDMGRRDSLGFWPGMRPGAQTSKGVKMCSCTHLKILAPCALHVCGRVGRPGDAQGPHAPGDICIQCGLIVDAGGGGRGGGCTGQGVHRAGAAVGEAGRELFKGASPPAAGSGWW